MTKNQKKRLHLIIGILLLTLGITIIGLSSFYYEISFFVTPSLLKTSSENRFLRLGGMVKNGSFKKNKEGYIFDVTDEKECVSVFYDGLLPPLFKEGQGVVAEGKLNSDKKIFMASKIFAKHDETYMPKTLVKNLKENGRWQKSY